MYQMFSSQTERKAKIIQNLNKVGRNLKNIVKVTRAECRRLHCTVANQLDVGGCR